ncbi:Coiled-coil domain-containing protein [Paragonimus westermani]|uniref:Coiled-coil domain-containing protein n=1 Tax=Paragonimus westermani TaxID=34504 RepID=A0A8T0DME7_9TREM|nr:Coiled-coil domain-containing protein [Paragonimus westermani]
MDIAVVKVPPQQCTESDGQSKMNREELAALRSKVDGLCEKTLNQEAEIKAKNTIITKLEDEKKNLRTQLDALTQKDEKLSKQLEEITTKLEHMNVEKSNESKKVENLKHELKIEQEKVSQMEARLQQQVIQRERCEHEASGAEEKLEQFVSQMLRIFDTYAGEADGNRTTWKDEVQLTRLISHAKDVVSENLKHRGRIQELSDKISQRDRQIAERNRTVDRLGEQLTKTAASDRETQNITHQLECSRENEQGLESRVHKLTSDLMGAQVRIRELERQLSQATHEQQRAVDVRHELADKEFTYFKEALATILSSSYYPCSPTEVAIKEHARRIVTEHKEQKELCARLESRLSEVSSRWDSVKSMKHEMQQQIERTERENHNLRDQIRQMESEMANSLIIRDEQRADRDRFFFYLCKLATKARIDQKVASRMEMDELQEAIYTRMGQIASGEFTLLTDVQANADRLSGLNRRVKRLQDQLSSKEVQLGLWRDKAATLEAQLTEWSRIRENAEHERKNAERAIARERKIEADNARLCDELTRLRAELLDLNDSKIRCIKVEDKLSELQKANEQLEDLRERQATKITELRDVIEKQQCELSDYKTRSVESRNNLTDELSSTRKTVEQLKRSERELYEFRALVGRLLGLDVEMLAVPNYDIVNRLENFIANHHLAQLEKPHGLPTRNVPSSPTVRTADHFRGPETHSSWDAGSSRSPRLETRVVRAKHTGVPDRGRTPEKREQSNSPKIAKRDPRKY